MSMSIIAVLVSLAMMLTGAGSAGAPAEASRTLRISDIQISLNGQRIDFDSALRIGASTDGQQALFDLAVEQNGQTLFPIQLSADNDRLALAYAGQAFGVPTATLNALMEQAQSQMTGTIQSDPQSQQLIDFLMNEFIPAYTGLFEVLEDPDRMAEIKEKTQQVVYGIVDRGEGVEDTVTLGDNIDFTVTRYNYTINSQQMFELADAVYTCDEALAKYYDAMIKLYSMMPEESGLNGITSLADLGQRLNLDMTMDITERVSEADELQMTDAVMTINLPAQPMPAAEGEEPQTLELPPLVMTIAAYEMGEEGFSQVEFNYDIQGNGVVFNMTVEKSGEDYDARAEMQINAVDGEGNSAQVGTIQFEANSETEENGDKQYSVNYEIDGGENGSLDLTMDGTEYANGVKEVTVDMTLKANGTEFTFSVGSDEQADGTSNAEVELGLKANGMAAGLSFNLAVTNEPIAVAFKADNITMIEDLSEEGINAQMQDQAFQSKIMQVYSGFMKDFQKLMGDKGVQTIMQLFASATASAPSQAAVGPAA